jgi:hypothetical protein
VNARPLAVYVTPSLPAALDAFSAEAAVLTPDPGVFDLPAALDERGLKPDLVIQDEALAPRVLLKGLHSLECPAVFWSRDPHLNHYWQGPYAALFDAAAVTQKAWIEPLRRAGARNVRWITWSYARAPWRPHAGRTAGVGFVGRISEHRPLRQLFADFLAARFPFRLQTDLPYAEVQPAYLSMRLAPGESIQGEITERLFIAAGAGCLPMEPAHDNGLDELFEPGREVMTYRDALELGDLTAHYLARPDEAGRMGRAAWERAGRDHLPERRLAALFDLAVTAPMERPRGREAERLFWLAAARCLESGRAPLDLQGVLSALARFPEDPECVTAGLRLMALAGRRCEALALGAGLAASGFARADAGFQLSLCALALDRNEFPLAARLHAALREALKGRPPAAASPAALYAEMAGDFTRAGERWRPGFGFDASRHLPACASECLYMSLALEPASLPVLRQAESLLRHLPGSGLVRLAYLSELSLRSREDFRLGVAIGLADLEAFRVVEGLEELRLARDQAAAKGKLPAFLRLLDQAGRGKRILAAL